MSGRLLRVAAACIFAAAAGASWAQVGWGTSTQGYAGQVTGLTVKETADEVRIELAADVLFDFDKADITPKAADALNQAAEVIRKNRPKKAIRIEGHTDGKGGADYNRTLSQRRAESVRAWLASKADLAKLRFETQGFGAQRPVAPNAKPDGSDDPEGRQKNRRVEIVIARR